MVAEIWKRLGARLLVERVQKRRWNLMQAQRELHIDRGVIERIELGENVETKSLERYVAALGFDLDTLLREVVLELQPAQESQRAEPAAAESRFPEETTHRPPRQKTGTKP